MEVLGKCLSTVALIRGITVTEKNDLHLATNLTYDLSYVVKGTVNSELL